MNTAIIIVSYGQAEDVADCLRAIDKLAGDDEIGVYVVENAGPEAFVALCDAIGTLCGPDNRHSGAVIGNEVHGRHVRWSEQTLTQSRRSVVCAEATGNLGYAGGVNSWLEQALVMQRWTGFWILNPDTSPKPQALEALVAACEIESCGMAGSVITDYIQQDRIMSRGIKWRPWFGSAFSVDHGKHISEPKPKLTSDIDAPCGTSVYITRSCLNAIGFMTEDYFLYYEDLDWGVRAKAAGLLCFADDSIVPHRHGTSLGSSNKRRKRSSMSVYLDARNTVLFTRRHNPKFIVVAALRLVLRAGEYLAIGSGRNFASALSGLAAGLKGEVGMPKKAPAAS